MAMNEPLPDHAVSRSPEIDQEANLQIEKNTSHKSFLDLPGEIRNKIYDLAYVKVENVTAIGDAQKPKALVDIRCRSDGCWLTATLYPKWAYREEIKTTFDLGLLFANKQLYEEASDVLRMGMFGRTAFFNSAPALYNGRGNWEQRNTIWDHTVDFSDEGLRKMRRCKIVVFLDRNRAASSWQWAAAEFGTVRDRISRLIEILSKGHNLEHLDIFLAHSGRHKFNHGSRIIDERVLEPFARLRGIKSAHVHGNVTASWANWLQHGMMCENGIELHNPQPVLEIRAKTSNSKKRKVIAGQDAHRLEERQAKEMEHFLESVEPVVEDVTKFLVAYDNLRQVSSRVGCAKK